MARIGLSPGSASLVAHVTSSARAKTFSLDSRLRYSGTPIVTVPFMPSRITIH